MVDRYPPSCVEPTFFDSFKVRRSFHTERRRSDAVATIYAPILPEPTRAFLSFTTVNSSAHISESMSLSTDYALSYPPTYCKPIRLVTNVYSGAASEKVRREAALGRSL